jgi:hypothetical protein
MKKIFISFIIFVPLISCTNISDKKNADATITDSISANALQVQSDSNTVTDNEYVLNYVVSVEGGNNYDSLREIALHTCDLLKCKFDTLDRYYNPLRRKIVLPDNYEDDVWAGEYIFRRHGEDFVSVEMQYAYISILTAKNETASEVFYKDTLKMFVFAGLFGNKKAADSLLGIIKPKYKNATIIPTEIFMGCMH